MTNPISPLQLEETRVRNLSIQGSHRARKKPKNSAEEQQDRLRVRLNMRRKAEEPVLIFDFDLTVSNPARPSNDIASINIDIEAAFRFPADWSSEEFKRLVPMLCLTNTFGVARGFIAQATAFFTDGPYWLPLTNAKVLLEKSEVDLDTLTEQLTTN